ncbi:uncharacterized protein LOC107814555 isoform X1 [Nicotiana tabacum]|uniref:Uncharacterized protein LOC107814555 isoform X1 n=5 Tax=Nicotiana TaxID=4085 RepID=A0AC58UT77_TOBAC|nr:PREDICTED: uncharacterized protein LOC104222252 isoform X1 [Nicotiana sylvestris]XP_009771763.1 PREDICTED: uncharacterized protein LOC104222252 isoform X1 [Nicotiana sylvestris]XP_016495477.1 PREDICTED: uncharacterized protein LOC107814555 isoform X1 [Nicotiana tabacum]
MSVMFRGRSILVRLSRRSTLLQKRTLCGNDKQITLGNNNNSKVSSNSAEEVNNSVSLSRHDAYKQLENLDFMTAAKMLFTDPPKKTKFGVDFHLVQFFFACLPSLAVYLVAQYSRYEMRRMEAEAELKKKAEEEAKAKELELMAEEEKQATDPQLSEVKARLDKLEETIKEIVVDSKKQSSDVAERSVSNAVKKGPGTTEPGTPDAKEKTTPSSDGKTQPRTSLPDQKQIKNEGSSPDAKK